ncbi:hypothetical protein WG899_04780 [Paucibacter sp. AS339]|uniref:hypothetical protein n=1 Tax=Paucibacter hankyongi TaxID=3133434 RepID=UPI00309A03A1
MEALDLSVLLRLLALYAHVLACFSAAAGIVLGDIAIFAPRRIDAYLLGLARKIVCWALLWLWLTGLVLIAIDTGFVLETMASKSKLLAKLSVVTLLTLNGAALHRWVFPGLGRVQAQPARAAWLPSLLGGFAAASWLFAAFLGVAKPLASVVGYSGFMFLYGGALLLASATSLILLRPRLSAQLMRAGDALPAPRLSLARAG